jgi:hypothetical protein
VLVPFGSVTAQAQLAPFVAVIAGVSGEVPAAYSGPNIYTSALAIGGGLIVTVDRDWDFYGHAGLNNVTRTADFPYIDIGISRRFGR